MPISKKSSPTSEGDWKEIATRLRVKRKAAGLSQSQAAEAWKINLRTLESWEREGRCPNVHNLARIEEILSDGELEREIASVIRARREAFALSQSQAAEAWNIDQSTLQQWEQGRCNFRGSELAALDNVLSISERRGMGYFIQAKRKAARLSQNQAAAAWKISKRTLGKWERGECLPRGFGVAALEKLLDNGSEAVPAKPPMPCTEKPSAVSEVEKNFADPAAAIAHLEAERGRFMRAAAELRALGHGWVNVAEQMEQECSKVEAKLAAAREAAKAAEATPSKETTRYNTIAVPCLAQYRAAGLLRIERFIKRTVLALDTIARVEQALWLPEGIIWRNLLHFDFLKQFNSDSTNADFAGLVVDFFGKKHEGDDEPTLHAGGFRRDEKEVAECIDNTLGVDFPKLHELFKKLEAKEKAYDTPVTETIETGY